VAEVLCESESAVYISAVSGRYNIIAELRVPGQRDLYDAIAAIRGPARHRIPGAHARQIRPDGYRRRRLPGDLHSLAEHIRTIDGVVALETWTHLEVFKEHYVRSLDVRG